MVLAKKVVVVGAGIAGLCAAVTAAERGMSVQVLEAQAVPGGLTLRSDGLMGGVDPRRLRVFGLEDNPEQYIAITFSAGGRRGQLSLVERLAYESSATITWLEAVGVAFDDHLFMADRSFFPRLHLPKSRTPAGYITPLYSEAKRLGVRFAFNEPVFDVQRRRSGYIVRSGTRAHPRSWQADCVIVAAGHFAGDRRKLFLEDPRLVKTRIIPAPSSIATGLRLLENLGAQSLHLSYSQKRITAADSKEVPPFFRNPANIIAVDASGHRFLQEDLRSINFIEELLNRTNGRFFFIGTPNWMNPESLADALPVQDLAQRLGLPAAELKQTIDDFNMHLRSGQADPFGRRMETMPEALDPQRLIGIELAVEMLTTLGGILISADGEVLDRTGRVIPGLFAAGDVTGGVHGRNSVVGNTLLAAALFGRRAAFKASSWLA